MPRLSDSLLGLGLSIACGLIISSCVIGYTVSRVAANKQSVVVKGLSEKAVKADQAQWSIVVHGEGKTLPEAMSRLRANRPTVTTFFQEQGFPADATTAGRETFYPVFRRDSKGMETRDIEGYVATQTLTVDSSDVARIEQAAGRIVALQEKGLALEVGSPEYLVSTLEKVKMSLIADATRNAHDRATEFARSGDAHVGAMRSASQGAFYILPARGSSSDDEYGGTYDKSTIDKLARVVVTVEYALTQ